MSAGENDHGIDFSLYVLHNWRHYGSANNDMPESMGGGVWSAMKGEHSVDSQQTLLMSVCY